MKNIDTVITRQDAVKLAFNAHLNIIGELTCFQLVTYYLRLEAWSQKHSAGLKELYRSCCLDTGTEATARDYAYFCSYMFVQCDAGIELRRSLLAEQTPGR